MSNTTPHSAAKIELERLQMLASRIDGLFPMDARPALVLELQRANDALNRLLAKVDG
jgi:hypothetical protein